MVENASVLTKGIIAKNLLIDVRYTGNDIQIEVVNGVSPVSTLGYLLDDAIRDIMNGWFSDSDDWDDAVIEDFKKGSTTEKEIVEEIKHALAEETKSDSPADWAAYIFDHIDDVMSEVITVRAHVSNRR